MKPDPQLADQWLSWWFHNAKGFVAIDSIGAAHGVKTQTFLPDRLDAVAEYAAMQADLGEDVYVRLTTLSERPEPGSRGSWSDSAECFGFALDLDGAWGAHKYRGRLRLADSAEEALSVLSEHPPSSVVSSGGGLYAFWRLTEPITDPATARLLLRRWMSYWKGCYAEAGIHIDSVGDLSRIMRLSGTINYKAEPRLVQPHHGGTGEAFRLGDVLSWLPQIEAPKRKVYEPGDRDAASPFDAVRCPEGHRLLAEALIDQRDFSHVPPYDDDDKIALLRPEASSQRSLTIGGDIDGNPAIGQVQVWSDAIEELPAGAYSVGQVASAMLFDGDTKACSEWLLSEGYGEATPEQERLDATEYLEGVPHEDVWPRLPPAFWHSRRAFRTIHQAALSRGCSPDAVLDAVLSRLAASLPHTLEIPPISAGVASLAFYSCIVAPSGVGKSAAVACAAELMPLPERVVEGVIGTGEGLTEAFMGSAPDPENPKKEVRQQSNWNLWIPIDEGRVLTDLEVREGATIGETMRRAWTGQMLGQGNASADRKRQIPAHNYSLGVVMGLQIAAAASMFTHENIDLGSAQRWLLSPAQREPQLRPRPPRPDWPDGHLKAGVSHSLLYGIEEVRFIGAKGSHRRHPLRYAAQITQELQDYHDDKIEGYITIDPLDSHQPLHLLKLAGLFALLDGRVEVTLEDWALAKVRWETHQQTRTLILAFAEWSAAMEREQQISAKVNEALAVSEVDRVGELAEMVGERLQAEGAQVTIRHWLPNGAARTEHAVIGRMLEKGLAVRVGDRIEPPT